MSAVRPVTEPFQRPIRLAVLISGGGTTLVNLVRQIAAGRLNAEIVRVISSRAGAGGIQKATQAGLSVGVHARKQYSDVESYSLAIFDDCRSVAADLVICGGFLSLLQVPADFAYRVMNIHPSLIPAFCGAGFYGEKVHQAVVDRGVKVSGCTVHFVDDVFDHGPIILQRTVPVLVDDSADSLAMRVFSEECIAYPEAISLYGAGRLSIEGRRVRVLSGAPAV